MLVYDVFKRIEFLINHGQVQYHEPEEFEDNFNSGCSDLVLEKVDRWRLTGVFPQELQALVKDHSFATSGNSGIEDLPEDFIHDLDLLAKPDDEPICEVEKVQPSAWARRVSSKARPPETSHPVAKFQDGKFYVEPDVDVDMTYLSKPIRAVFGYDYASDGRSIVFNEETSTDTNIPMYLLNELVPKVLKYYGVEQKDDLFVQFDAIHKRDNNKIDS